jgi:hypothetical protein
MKNTFSNEQIQVVMEKSGITRKSALKKLGKMTPKELAALTPATPAPVVDVKSRAANDDTNQLVGKTAAPAPAKATPTPKPPAPATPAGDARKEGIRLFALAGKPKKEDFIHVYGEMGAKWTWVARAKAVGLATAEEAAAQFQKMRAGKPQQFVKAEPTTEKK